MDHQPRSTDESSFINEFIVLILVRNPHHLKAMFPKFHFEASAMMAEA
jgi:hypothetical protein